MKKYATGLVAVLFALSASAFTSAKTIDEYYLDPVSGQMILITTPGECKPGGEFCKYQLRDGQEDNGNPVNYEPLSGEGLHWEPSVLR